MITPLMEQMAIAILKGDRTSALALADIIVNELPGEPGGVAKISHLIRPITKSVKMIAYIHPDVVFNEHQLVAMDDEVREWLADDGPVTLALSGVVRVEFFETTK